MRARLRHPVRSERIQYEYMSASAPHDTFVVTLASDGVGNGCQSNAQGHARRAEEKKNNATRTVEGVCRVRRADLARP